MSKLIVHHTVLHYNGIIFRGQDFRPIPTFVTRHEDREVEAHTEVELDYDTWILMGAPRGPITVTVEPGDRLNPEGAE
jgi:hypothetical protein